MERSGGGRVRSLRAVVALAALFAATEVGAETRLCIDVRYPTPAPRAALVDAMKSEVAAIWAPYGVYFVWADNEDCTSDQSIDGSFDVRVERNNRPLAVRWNGTVLGSTRLQLRAIDHAPISIDYDAIERILESIPPHRLVARTGHSVLESPDVGRAIGRVLAHEIGHVLLALSFHPRRGLMRASYLPDDVIGLERNSFVLSEDERRRLHSREDAFRAAIGAEATRPPHQ